jgi:hypothetical protein
MPMKTKRAPTSLPKSAGDAATLMSDLTGRAFDDRGLFGDRHRCCHHHVVLLRFFLLFLP